MSKSGGCGKKPRRKNVALLTLPWLSTLPSNAMVKLMSHRRHNYPPHLVPKIEKERKRREVQEALRKKEVGLANLIKGVKK
jgi:hypothetical protein